jgi:hypothetical protein
MQQRRGFRRRVAAVISSPRTPSLIHRFNAGVLDGEWRRLQNVDSLALTLR